MNMKDKIIIVGAFHETVELCELCDKEIIGIIDGSYSAEFLGYPILGTDDDAINIYRKYSDCKIVISPDSPRIKQKLAQIYSEVGFSFATVISPKANISRTATIGQGVVIQSGVNVSSFAVIGDFCKLNFNCNIMHDVNVGNFCIIAPNAVLLGRSKVGSNSYIGACSTILTYTVIEEASNVKPCSTL